MKKTKRTRRKSPEMLALQRQQLDRRLGGHENADTPSVGWIRTLREALGMTVAQLGKRLQISPQSVHSLERNEQRGTISLERLRRAIAAMNCDVRIAVAPRGSLTAIVREQAAFKAREERNQLVHTMSLEAQSAGVADALDLERATELWMTTRSRRLWD